MSKKKTKHTTTPQKVDRGEPVLSVRAEDCEWDFFRAGGPGGQKQNKTSSGARCKHLPSGAVGEARDAREQRINKRSAFVRMVETKEFKSWIKKQVGKDELLIAQVERELWPDRLKVETKDENGNWS